MKVQTVALLTALVAVSSARANVADVGYFTVDRVELEDITELENAVGLDFMSVENPRQRWRGAPSQPINRSELTDPIGEAEVILDRIIAIGDKIWKIIEKNKPVVDTKYSALAALPEGAIRWQQLESWATPETRVYRMSYKNVYGMTVVDFAFRMAYTYGGSVNGKGKYLANIEIEPRALDVAWGYKFQAVGTIQNVHNAGTKAKPLAGAEIVMDWQVNTVMKHSQQSNRFFVRGDGLFKNLSDGTLPAL